LGAGGGATVTLDVLVEIDHFPCGKPGICGSPGSCPPDGEDADGKASTLGINTGRVDTTPDDAADPTPPADPEPNAERLFAPVDPALEESVDAPPRAEGEPSSDDDCAPGSACATTGAATDAPSATVNAPAASSERTCTNR
jgi:hypothetical protein